MNFGTEKVRLLKIYPSTSFWDENLYKTLVFEKPTTMFLSVLANLLVVAFFVIP